MKNSCLTKDADQVTLNKRHSFYFQVQMKIAVTNLRCCDRMISQFFFKNFP